MWAAASGHGQPALTDWAQRPRKRIAIEMDEPCLPTPCDADVSPADGWDLECSPPERLQHGTCQSSAVLLHHDQQQQHQESVSGRSVPQLPAAHQAPGPPRLQLHAAARGPLLGNVKEECKPEQAHVLGESGRPVAVTSQPGPLEYCQNWEIACRAGHVMPPLCTDVPNSKHVCMGAEHIEDAGLMLSGETSVVKDSHSAIPRVLWSAGQQQQAAAQYHVRATSIPSSSVHKSARSAPSEAEVRERCAKLARIQALRDEVSAHQRVIENLHMLIAETEAELAG